MSETNCQMYRILTFVKNMIECKKHLAFLIYNFAFNFSFPLFSVLSFFRTRLTFVST